MAFTSRRMVPPSQAHVIAGWPANCILAQLHPFATSKDTAMLAISEGARDASPLDMTKIDAALKLRRTPSHQTLS